MQLHKYYGFTLRGALAAVRQELGEDALILETRTLEPGDAAERMNPGARFEVCAVLEAPVAEEGLRGGGAPFGAPNVPNAPSAVAGPGQGRPTAGRAAAGHAAYGAAASFGSNARRPGFGLETPQAAQTAAAWKPRPADAFLEDLGLLRAQIRELLEDHSPENGMALGGLDLREYQDLIALGVSHETLAPHFRRWLQWRTATMAQRRYLAAIGQAPEADGMQGESLREWLWHAWSMRQGFNQTLDEDQSVLTRRRVVGLIGMTGAGKTTTLAKISSILRHAGRQNNVIVTLDTHRFGANEQIRRLTKLLGVALHEIVTPEDLSQSMETWGHFDWIGIDTPGGMTLSSQAGRLYGSILAQTSDLETLIMLPAGLNQADSQAQLKRGEAFRARRMIFSKLDETTKPGGLVNLTMDGNWKIDSMTAGQRVPDDWSPASGRLLWNQVLAPEELDCMGGVPS